MNKYLIRAVSALLIPCLLGDPVTAAAIHPISKPDSRTLSRYTITQNSLFLQQALANLPRWAKPFPWRSQTAQKQLITETRLPKKTAEPLTMKGPLRAWVRWHGPLLAGSMTIVIFAALNHIIFIRPGLDLALNGRFESSVMHLLEYVWGLKSPESPLGLLPYFSMMGTTVVLWMLPFLLKNWVDLQVHRRGPARKTRFYRGLSTAFIFYTASRPIVDLLLSNMGHPPLYEIGYLYSWKRGLAGQPFDVERGDVIVNLLMTSSALVLAYVGASHFFSIPQDSISWEERQRRQAEQAAEREVRRLRREADKLLGGQLATEVTPQQIQETAERRTRGMERMEQSRREGQSAMELLKEIGDRLDELELTGEVPDELTAAIDSLRKLSLQFTEVESHIASARSLGDEALKMAPDLPLEDPVSAVRSQLSELRRRTTQLRTQLRTKRKLARRPPSGNGHSISTEAPVHRIPVIRTSRPMISDRPATVPLRGIAIDTRESLSIPVDIDPEQARAEAAARRQTLLVQQAQAALEARDPARAERLAKEAGTADPALIKAIATELFWKRIMASPPSPLLSSILVWLEQKGLLNRSQQSRTAELKDVASITDVILFTVKMIFPEREEAANARIAQNLQEGKQSLDGLLKEAADLHNQAQDARLLAAIGKALPMIHDVHRPTAAIGLNRLPNPYETLNQMGERLDSLKPLSISHFESRALAALFSSPAYTPDQWADTFRRRIELDREMAQGIPMLHSDSRAIVVDGLVDRKGALGVLMKVSEAISDFRGITISRTVSAEMKERLIFPRRDEYETPRLIRRILVRNEFEKHIPFMSNSIHRQRFIDLFVRNGRTIETLTFMRPEFSQYHWEMFPLQDNESANLVTAFRLNPHPGPNEELRIHVLRILLSNALSTLNLPLDERHRDGVIERFFTAQNPRYQTPQYPIQLFNQAAAPLKEIAPYLHEWNLPDFLRLFEPRRIANRDLAEAISQLSERLKTQEDTFAAGKTAYEQGSYAAAVEELRKAHHHPGAEDLLAKATEALNAETILNSGLTAYHERRYPDALHYLRQVQNPGADVKEMIAIAIAAVSAQGTREVMAHTPETLLQQRLAEEAKQTADADFWSRQATGMTNHRALFVARRESIEKQLKHTQSDISILRSLLAPENQALRKQMETRFTTLTGLRSTIGEAGWMEFEMALGRGLMKWQDPKRAEKEIRKMIDAAGERPMKKIAAFLQSVFQQSQGKYTLGLASAISLIPAQWDPHFLLWGIGADLAGFLISLFGTGIVFAAAVKTKAKKIKYPIYPDDTVTDDQGLPSELPSTQELEIAYDQHKHIWLGRREYAVRKVLRDVIREYTADQRWTINRGDEYVLRPYGFYMAGPVTFFRRAKAVTQRFVKHTAWGLGEIVSVKRPLGRDTIEAAVKFLPDGSEHAVPIEQLQKLLTQSDITGLFSELPEKAFELARQDHHLSPDETAGTEELYTLSRLGAILTILITQKIKPRPEDRESKKLKRAA